MSQQGWNIMKANFHFSPWSTELWAVIFHYNPSLVLNLLYPWGEFPWRKLLTHIHSSLSITTLRCRRSLLKIRPDNMTLTLMSAASNLTWLPLLSSSNAMTYLVPLLHNTICNCQQLRSHVNLKLLAAKQWPTVCGNLISTGGKGLLSYSFYL